MGRDFHLIWILAFTSFIGCGSFTKGKAAAEKQVSLFHQQFNDKDIASILSSAHPDLFNFTPEAKIKELLSNIRENLGSVTGSTNKGWNIRTGGGGKFVVLVQDTTFQKGSGTEKFTFKIKSGQPLLFGYHINSEDLIGKEPPY